MEEKDSWRDHKYDFDYEEDLYRLERQIDLKFYSIAALLYLLAFLA